MVAIVFILEFPERFFLIPAFSLGHPIDVVGHLRAHLLFCETAYRGKLSIHGDIDQIIKFAEDTELREFRNARKENEFEVGVGSFEW